MRRIEKAIKELEHEKDNNGNVVVDNDDDHDDDGQVKNTKNKFIIEANKIRNQKHLFLFRVVFFSLQPGPGDSGEC